MIGNLYFINHNNYITLTLRAVDRVTTLSYWRITSPVSLDTKSSSSGHQAMDLQPSSTGPASMSLDLPPPSASVVSVELGASGQLEFDFESMSPR